MRFNRSLLLLAAATVLALSGCRSTVPVLNVNDGPLQPRGDATLSDVDEAIWRAGRRLGWDVEILKPGELRGTYRPRSHVAVVSITHDGARFDIVYQSSENLKVGEGGRIHPNYNVWVGRLADAISSELIRPRYPSGR